MRKLSTAVVAATLIVSLLHGGIPAAHAGGGETFYVALGTSLAVGFQPGHGPTDKGYVDDLVAEPQEQIPGLSLRNVGCPGETSRSMITAEALALPLRGRVTAGRGGRVPARRIRDRSRSSRWRSVRTTSSNVASQVPAGSTAHARPTSSHGCRPG